MKRALISALCAVLASASTLLGTAVPADAKTKTTYYYFYVPGAPKGPIGDEFIVMRVRGNNVAGLYALWGSEGSLFTGRFSGSKIKLNYEIEECSEWTSNWSSSLNRTGSKSSVKVKGFKRGLKTTSLAKLDEKYVSLAKAMYPNDSHRWIQDDYFSQMFADAKRASWINEGYC
jgi:hypothetical protein